MGKELLNSAFSSTPLKEALKEKPIEEYTPDQVKLSELGISMILIKTITLGWRQLHSGKKKVFHPNNESFENLTKGFWNYLLDCIHPVDLLKIDTTQLTEELTDLTLKQIMNKNRTISDDYQKENEILREQIVQLKEQSQNLIDSVEVIEVNKDLFKILGWLYNLMNTKMDFFNIEKVKESLIQSIQEHDVNMDKSMIDECIDRVKNQLSEKEMKMLTEIEEALEK